MTSGKSTCTMTAESIVRLGVDVLSSLVEAVGEANKIKTNIIVSVLAKTLMITEQTSTYPAVYIPSI